MKKILPLAENGFTLVELLVASAVGLVVAGGIFSFILLTGQLTDEAHVQQQMGLEASAIIETYSRTVREARALMPATDTVVPPADVVTPTLKAIGSGGDITTLRFAAPAYLIMTRTGFSETLATGLDTTQLNTFVIYKDGFRADLRFALQLAGSESTYRRKPDTLQVRCRNYVPPMLITPPEMTPLENFANNQITNKNATGSLGGIITVPPDNVPSAGSGVNQPPVADPPVVPPSPPAWWKKRRY